MMHNFLLKQQQPFTATVFNLIENLVNIPKLQNNHAVKANKYYKSFLCQHIFLWSKKSLQRSGHCHGNMEIAMEISVPDIDLPNII